MSQSQGPLAGLRIVEISGLGPTPFTAQLFSDMGAEVLRIARPGSSGAENHLLGMANDPLDRGRDVVELDLKSPEGQAAARRLILAADALVEGMRPGAMERLGLGPGDFPDHPRLVYGRMTGWGQHGPLALRAGHDINYLALSGAQHAIGTPETPVYPLNLVGDFGGGAMYLAFGMMAALWSARATGQGQVVDAAITDGVAHLLGMIHGMAANGLWRDQRAVNLLDGGVPWYGIYPCADGRHLAIAPIEEKFWAEFQRLAGFAPGDLPDRDNKANWPALRAAIGARLLERDRDGWAAVFEGSDACVTPVLSLAEAARHPHNVARRAYVVHEGMVQPAPAPRLSRTPGAIGAGSTRNRIGAEAALARWQARGRDEVETACSARGSAHHVGPNQDHCRLTCAGGSRIWP